ncbi:MAG: GNAT family N-acetyltransferase [Bergeyella sp.]
MIWFEELQNRKKISRLFYVYEKTFHENERRDKEQFLSLAETPDAYIYSAKDAETAVGYLIVWEFPDFHFLEHFEVFEEFRNRKYGAEILTSLAEKHPKIILETEPPYLNETAERRIGFYERNGFKIIDKNYIQPSYGEGKNELPLFLMANYEPENIEEIIKDIHEKVYEQEPRKK